MAYTINQVRHLYVVPSSIKIVKDSDALTNYLDPVADMGKLIVKNFEKQRYLRFEYGSGSNTIKGGPKVDIPTITYAKYVPSKKFRYYLRTYKVSFEGITAPTDKVDGLFTLKAAISALATQLNAGALSNYSYADVKQKTASEVYIMLAHSMAKTLNKRFPNMVNVFLETGGTDAKQVATLVPVKHNTRLSDLTATYTGVVLKETAPLLSSKGTIRPTGLEAFVASSNVENGVYLVSHEIIFSDTEKDDTKNYVNSGMIAASMEKWYQQHRGNDFRLGMHPEDFGTEYLADPKANYDVFEMHFSYRGEGVNDYKSEQDITLFATTEEIKKLADVIKDAVVIENLGELNPKDNSVILEEC